MEALETDVKQHGFQHIEAVLVDWLTSPSFPWT